MREHLLVLEQVNKHYLSGNETLHILSGLNLEVCSGDLITICGESGCGKSTLLNIIAGMEAHDSGSVQFQSRDISLFNRREFNEYRQRCVAMIFQMHHLIRELSALENVMLPSLISGEKDNQAREKAANLLQKVGLDDRLKHYPYQLSGGECQRVAVARALINSPALVLADEPTGSLDEKNSRVVEELLLKLLEESESTLLLVTHDRAFASKGKKRYYLHQGQLELL